MDTLLHHLPKTLAVLGVVALLSASQACAQAPQQQTQGTLKPGVVAIPADGSVILTNITPTSVTLSGKVPPLKADEVIVGGPAPGIMRHIVSLSQAGNATTLQTTDATLSDVFQSADIGFNHTLRPGKPINVAPGITFNN